MLVKLLCRWSKLVSFCASVSEFVTSWWKLFSNFLCQNCHQHSNSITKNRFYLPVTLLEPLELIQHSKLRPMISISSFSIWKQISCFRWIFKLKLSKNSAWCPSVFLLTVYYDGIKFVSFPCRFQNRLRLLDFLKVKWKLWDDFSWLYVQVFCTICWLFLSGRRINLLVYIVYFVYSDVSVNICITLIINRHTLTGLKSDQKRIEFSIWPVVVAGNKPSYSENIIYLINY